jgi:predicted ATP-binding protein involved in virulence
MKLRKLHLEGFRGIDEADIAFEEDMTLLIGVNGAGKSSVLAAITVVMAAVARRVYGASARVPVDAGDVRAGHEVASINCEFEIDSDCYSFAMTWGRQRAASSGFQGGLPPKDANPKALAVYFSTRRAHASRRPVSKTVARGGPPAATDAALTDHDFELNQIVEWMVARAKLGHEVFAPLDAAIGRFLPGYSTIRPSADVKPLLLIKRGETTLDVWRLSDGERGALALVLGLTRRMALLDPDAADPAATSEALILIDEIDLHLHPSWQREIVHKLRDTFPQAQYVMTSHSPQVIGEVAAHQIRILSNDDVGVPQRTYGVDASSILEEVMLTPARNSQVDGQLRAISDAIHADKLAEAREMLRQAASDLGEDDAEMLRLSTMIDFLED